jgi:hypothetical protein
MDEKRAGNKVRVLLFVNPLHAGGLRALSSLVKIAILSSVADFAFG